ncbi:OmpA family protein [Leptospira sp. 96542]|nr:OmpA family protein [Leptospira sp. 96542]
MAILYPSIFIWAKGEETTFQWKLKNNQVLELNEYHDVFFRVGSKTVEREDKNRVVMKINSCSTDKCEVNAFFDTYLRFGKTAGPFIKDKEFLSNFSLYNNGKYDVPNEFIMPNLRSFPSFPDTAVQTNDVWKIPAEESFDFSKERIKVTVTPEYIFHGKFPWSENQYKGFCEKITYTYPIYYSKLESNQLTPNVPYKIFGFANGTVFFNAERGVPEFKDVKLSYTFIYPNGTVQEANFHIKGIYFLRDQINEKEKESIREDVLKDLIVGYGDGAKDPNGLDKNSPSTKQDESPISVRSTEDGITFSLDSILFDFNDAKLKEEAEVSIKKIAQILKKYPDREIRVAGHTDNIGKRDYNLKLSEDRAKSVLGSLVNNYNFDEKNISYKGYADDFPIVPNNSDDNRKKNRRVDITLVLD